MIRSHHIATVLVAEHQRELRASARRRWRLSSLFGRRAAESESEPVPPASVASAGGDGHGSAPALPVAAATADAVPARVRIVARRRPGAQRHSDRKTVGV
jgi:hypothetical protein